MFKKNYDFKRAKDFFNDYITYSISPMELLYMLDNEEKDFQVVDLRNLEDFEISHIPTAIHISEEHLLDNLDKLSKNKTIIVYCYNQFCQLSAKKAVELVNEGYKVVDLLGGFKTWIKFRFRTES